MGEEGVFSRRSFTVKGHPNISGLHKSTFMFTRDDYVTETGDCIIGVSAESGLHGLGRDFLDVLKREGSGLIVRLSCGNFSEEIRARGSPELSFTDVSDMVVRKSGFTCPRTLAVNADKAACDISRELIELLRGGEEMRVELILEV